MSTPTLAALSICRAALPGVKFSTTVSEDPARFGRVSRIGGHGIAHWIALASLSNCTAQPQGQPDTAWTEQSIGTIADGFQAASSGGPWAGLWVTDWVMNSLADYPNPDYEKHSRFQFTGHSSCSEPKVS
ncbi:hypothetical protein SAMN04488548_12625 [Gordonia westfalica]|uniref:Uncharacterized protein n=1 Tax=Gordonia westfalica TaxID=158898 RepID=A0A1H2E0D1_9ACTN|nr:hypothetical protein SAMN04488548_12625 [Gordonia westfalica]